jgi:gas vesicle protein
MMGGRVRGNLYKRGLLVGAVIGAFLMFILDPRAGRRRRALIRDKVAHFANEAQETATNTIPKKADYLSGLVGGGFHRVRERMTGHEEPIPDESEYITDRVMSVVFRDPKLPKGQVNVNTADRVVYLRGNVEDENIVREIVERTRTVPGVRDVVNLINRPDVDPSAIRAEDLGAI